MRKHLLRATIVLALLALTQLLGLRPLQAAPGDFITKWGANQHFSRTGGVAVDGSGNVYVTDTAKIQVFNSSGIRIRQWGSYGSGDGQFMYPNGIAVDGTGTVYVTDSARIQVFTSSGVFLRKWTHPDWGTGNGPSWVASDGNGKVYVTDRSTVKLFDSNGNFVRQVGSTGVGPDQYMSPDGVAIDSSGNVYVVDTSANERIQVYAANGDFLRTLVSADTTGITFASGLAVDKNGNIYATQGGPVEIYDVVVFNSAGVLIRELRFLQQYADEHYWQPRDVAVDAAGTVYTVDQHNDGIRAFGSNGNLLSQWWTYGTELGQLSRPTWLALDDGGNLYETDAYDQEIAIRNDRVRVFSGAGTPLRMWTSDFCQTAGIAFDGGQVFVLDDSLDTLRGCESNDVFRIFDTLGVLLGSSGVPVPGQNFFGVAIQKGGSIDIRNFLVTDTANSNVRVYDKGGNLLTIFGSEGSGNGQFLNPEGIAVDGAGNIFVVDTGNSRVQVFNSAYGFVRTWGGPGSGDGQFSQPSGIAVDGSGHVFVADAGNNRIQVFNTSGAFLLKWGSLGDENGFFNNPRGVVVDKSGAKVYVADTGNNRIQVFQGFAAAGPFTISGTVRQGSATGPVLAGAAVSIAGKTAYTSSTGTFCIKGIPAGTYTLTISRSGYVTKTITGYEVKSDQSGLTFYLTRITYSLSGTVRKGSATGPVLPGAIVSIAGKKATTASDGTFTVTGIPAGTYNLYISKSGYVTKTITGYVVNSNKSGLNFYLTPATYTVGGTIRQGSSSGPVLPGATVSIAGKSTTTSSAGTFSISGIPAGTYTLTISKTGYYTKTITGFTVNCNRTGLMYYLVKRY